MRDTTEIYFTIILASIFFVLLVTIIGAATWRYYARRKAHEKSLQEFDHILMQSRLEIQEQTFRSISQEMHDNICQVLSLAKLNVNTVDLANAAGTREKLEESSSLIAQGLQSLRDLAKSLQGGAIQRTGLLPALEQEMRRIEKLGIMQTVFRILGEPVNIEENKSLIIFRIAQEALHNVIKHAEATVLEMQVKFSSTELNLLVRDNGKGMQVQGQDDGSGMQNMKDRARIIGAQLKIENAETGGTIITVTLPL